MRIRIRRRRSNQLVVFAAVSTAIAQATSRPLAQIRPAPVMRQSLALMAEYLRTSLRINDKLHALEIEPRVTLLNALREYIHLNGLDLDMCRYRTEVRAS